MPTQWITHAGKRIIYSDFRECKSEAEAIALFEKTADMVLAEKEPVLTMNNFDGIDVSAAFLARMRKRGEAYKHLVKAKAVLGVTGIKKIYINTYSILTGIDARAFTTEQEALAYLVSRK